MRIDGKKTLIVGGARGIGFAIGQRLLDAGADITVADIEFGAAESAADQLKGTALKVDVTDENSVRDMVKSMVARAGRIDVIINCAGVTLGIRSIVDTALEDFERVQRINVTGTFLCCREAARAMIAQGSGSLINIASVTAKLAQKGGVSYGTSKAAVAHFTRILAMELAEHGVRANAIAPGPVETPLMKSHGEQRKMAYVARIPMGRVAQPFEIGGAALFLSSDEASFVTGEVLHVDGGFSVSGLR